MNHQQNDSAVGLRIAKFTATNGMSETTQRTPFFAFQRRNTLMPIFNGATSEQDHRYYDAHLVQATMQQIHEYCRLEMRHSDAIQDKGVNGARILLLNIEEGSEVWLDTTICILYDLPECSIGNGWDILQLAAKYVLLPMSWIIWLQYVFTEYSWYSFWNLWQKIQWTDNRICLHPWSWLMVEENIRFRVLRIVRCVRTTCSI